MRTAILADPMDNQYGMSWQPISGEMGYRDEPVERQMDQDLLKQVMAHFLYPSEKWQTNPQTSPYFMKNHYDFFLCTKTAIQAGMAVL